jgi:hypothetical protein
MISYQYNLSKIHGSKFIQWQIKLNGGKFKPFQEQPSFKQHLIKNITKIPVFKNRIRAYALQYGIETVYPLGDDNFVR